MEDTWIDSRDRQIIEEARSIERERLAAPVVIETRRPSGEGTVVGMPPRHGPRRRRRT